MDLEHLLTHEAFVRSLALRLVKDEHRAADIVQNTWLAVLRSPPQEDRPFRAWVTRVVKNFARMEHRSEKHRARRERAFEGPAPAPEPREILAREESRRRLVEAVLGLEEPYRAVVLLRYYEGCTPREAARRLGVPLETVRTRVRRGVEKLKRRLDAVHGGDREAWVVSLAVLAGIKSAGAGAAPSAAWRTGGSWSGKAKLLAAAAGAVAVCAGLVYLAVPEGAAPPGKLPAVAEGTGSALPPAAEEAAPPPEVPAAAAAAARELLPPSPAAAGAGATEGEGKVCWKGTCRDTAGRPLASERRGDAVEEVRLRAARSGDGKGRAFLAACDGRGGFTFPELRPGKYAVEVWIPEVKTWFDAGEVEVRGQGTVTRDVRLPPGAGARVSGVLVDGNTGAPLRDGERRRIWVLLDLRRGGNAPGTPADGARGTFRFRCVPPGDYDLVLNGPGVLFRRYPRAVHAEPGGAVEGLRLELPPAGELRLVLSGFSPEERGRVMVRFFQGRGRPLVRPADWIGPGKPPLFFEAGKVTVRVEHPGLGRVERTVEIEAGGARDLEIGRGDFGAGALEEGGRLSGRVRRADGRAVAGAALLFEPEGRGGRGKRLRARTDEDGRFTLAGAAPGPWRARCVFAPEGGVLPDTAGFVPPAAPVCSVGFRNLRVPARASGACTLDLVLPEGSVRAVLRDGATRGPPRTDLRFARCEVKAVEDPLFVVSGIAAPRAAEVELPGLPDGEYLLLVVLPGYRAWESPAFRVEKGRTRVDLGEVRLEPCGVVDLEVVDPSGRAVPYTASCNGRALGGHSGCRTKIAPGVTRCWELPCGTVTLEVRAPGFASREVRLELRGARPEAVRVVMQPEGKGKERKEE